MKNLKSKLALASLSAALLLGASRARAQDPKPDAKPDAAQPPRAARGNFDPEQWRQRMMENYREQLEAKDDGEWKLIEARIQKIMDARREIGFGGMAGFGRGGRGADGRARRGGGESSPEAEALQKAIDSKASPEELKTKLAKYRDAHKEKEAKLDAAQEDLRKVLSVRQEAAAVLGGLLK